MHPTSIKTLPGSIFSGAAFADSIPYSSRYPVAGPKKRTLGPLVLKRVQYCDRVRAAPRYRDGGGVRNRKAEVFLGCESGISYPTVLRPTSYKRVEVWRTSWAIAGVYHIVTPLPGQSHS
jgi:hypothetical protein